MKQYLVNYQLKDVKTFTFSLSDTAALSELQWENQDEFEMNGRMYDVLQKKVVNHSLIIHCISDEKETGLINSYEKINKENNTPSSSKWASVLKLISTAFEPVTSIDYYLGCSIITFSFTDYHTIFPASYIAILTPPPQLA